MNIRINQVEPDVPIEFLAPFVEDKARTSFDPHLFGVLIVCSETGKSGARVDALLDRGEINAKGFGHMALDIPTTDVAAVAEKRRAECAQYLAEHTP